VIVAEKPSRLQSSIGIPQGGCLCMMEDQGNDLGVENLDILKRQHPCLFFLAIRDQFFPCLNTPL